MNETDRQSLAAARLSTRLFFFLAGFANAAWAPMVPFAKARTGLGTSALGLVLMGLGVGAAAVMPVIAWALRRHGSRRTMIAGAILVTFVLPLLAILANPAALALALLCFGFGIGGLDAAMNAQAVEVEILSRKPLMSGFHGMFSLGGLAASLGLTLLLGAGLSVLGAALVVTLLFLGVWLWRAGTLLPGRERPHASGRRPGWSIALHPLVLLIGALCVVGFLGEGAALDWSALFLAQKGLPASYGGLGYAAFSVAMVAGRLSGDRMTRRMGARFMLRASAVVGMAGWAAAVGLPGPFALFGFCLVGLGAANIVPLLFSAAARVPGVPPSVSIPIISALGYAGLLCGPAIVGFVAGATSLGLALLLVGLLLLAVLSGAKVAPGR
ncbi:MAG TPA: MFS transporter [Acidisoma sp.]|uniref:MFS transporter n=1 Tax=Acidisoma sp. TaxID=1872115 RepID=UPI002D1AFE22|nr:MFS transporter [Acidisoma sp.]HTI02512.1 MFS transporter [Acidisoma sp.]